MRALRNVNPLLTLTPPIAVNNLLTLWHAACKVRHEAARTTAIRPVLAQVPTGDEPIGDA